MDEIYTILANTSFIPHDSIMRGPHQISIEASRCKRDAADIRLLEILPYVDRNLFQGSSWLWDGSFANYRMGADLPEEHAQLGHACRPSWAEDPSYLMKPGTVHLTHGGQGLWDPSRSWKLQYDTRKHAMRIYGEEEWYPYQEDLLDEERPGYDWNDDAIFAGSNTTGSLSVNRLSRHWSEWTDAPTFLRWIRDAYLSAAWSPWETSSPNNRWGLPSSNYTSTLLLKNGWPDKLDIDKFRADFIRAQYKPSGRGWAEGAFQEIKNHEDDDEDPFNILHRRKSARWHEHHLKYLEQAEKHTEGLTSLWTSLLVGEITKSKLDQQEKEFEDAKELIQRLCPNDICVEEEDLILWEFRELEKTYTKAQLEPDTTTMCERHIQEWEDKYITQLPSDQLSKCVSRLNLKRHWLRLAYQQSRAEAYAHCARHGKPLLPPASFEALAARRIAEYELKIAEYLSIPAVLDAWQEKTGAPDSTMKFLREKYRSAQAWDTRQYERHIEKTKKSLDGSDGDEDRLYIWNEMEIPASPRSKDYMHEKDFY